MLLDQCRAIQYSTTGVSMPKQTKTDKQTNKRKTSQDSQDRTNAKKTQQRTDMTDSQPDPTNPAKP